MTYRKVGAFTAKALNAAKSGDTITEALTRGLRFVVGLGVRSWFYRYDWQGAQRQVTFGSWPTMGIAEARTRFAELKGARRAGHNPADIVRGDFSANVAKGHAVTIAAVCEAYLREVERNRNEKSAAEARRLFRQRVLPVIGGRAAETFTTPDAVRFLTEVRDESLSSARVLRGELRAAWRLALEAGQVTGANPFADVMKGRLAQPRRSRYLDDNELRALLDWLPTCGMSGDVQDALRLTLMTACRSGEVVAMRWKDVDLKAGRWTIKDTKTDEPRTVVLPRQAIAIIKERRQSVAVGSEFVFPSPIPDRHIRQHALVWGVSTYRAGLKIDPWTTHDLRRSARTGLARLGVSDAVAEAALGHTKGGIEGTYDLHRYESEVGQALQKWCDHLQGLRVGAKVVKLRTKARNKE